MSHKFSLIFAPVVFAAAMPAYSQDQIPPIQNQVLANCQIVNNSYRRDSSTETGFREYTYAGSDGLIFHASTDNSKTKGASNRFSFVFSGQLVTYNPDNNDTQRANKWRILTSAQMGGSGSTARRCLSYDGFTRARFDACNAEKGIFSKDWQDRDFFLSDIDSHRETNEQNRNEKFVNLVNRDGYKLSKDSRYLIASGDFAIDFRRVMSDSTSPGSPLISNYAEWLVIGCVNKWGVRVDPGQYSWKRGQ